jgi:exodeoxyribonuclease-5
MEGITLTRKQEEGLKLAVDRYKHKEPYTCIAGYAGSGKSTLVNFIIKALNIPEDQIAYVAYTGKASLVLQQKGCPGATTAHRLLYHTKELPNGTFVHTPRKHPEKPFKLIVVDEISMLEKQQWEILMKWKIPVICLGDPFQLPPIAEDNGVLQHPHIFLDEIMRQAQDSEIIRLSMDVREGKYLNYFKGKDVRIVPKDNIADKLLVTADMVLCGKNATRFSLNNRIRRAHWGDKYVDEPMNGDKCICLKNQWAVGDLVNGSIGTISNIRKEDTFYLKPKMLANFDTDYNDWFVDLSMDYKLFVDGKPTVNQDNWKMYPKEIRPMEFDYAYAVTVHKAQGSEYKKVVLFNEYLGRDKEQWQRWLYTGITRSSEKLVIAL